MVSITEKRQCTYSDSSLKVLYYCRIRYVEKTFLSCSMKSYALRKIKKVSTICHVSITDFRKYSMIGKTKQ